jgi:hypothetical protein
VSLLRRLLSTSDVGKRRRLIAHALPPQLAAGGSDKALEALRTRLVAVPVPSAGLGAQDCAGAVVDTPAPRLTPDRGGVLHSSFRRDAGRERRRQ